MMSSTTKTAQERCIRLATQQYAHFSMVQCCQLTECYMSRALWICLRKFLITVLEKL